MNTVLLGSLCRIQTQYQFRIYVW